jgi:hypothetical protein
LRGRGWVGISKGRTVDMSAASLPVVRGCTVEIYG